MFKHDVLENFRLQISGISRQQTPFMLVFIGAQHSHLHQVLLPILPFTLFVATSLLLARSLLEFLPQATGTFDFVSSRVYGYKPNFLKLVILLVSDIVPDENRDLLDEILPNQMIRKLNSTLLLIAWLSLHDVMKFSNLTLRKIRLIMAGSRKHRQNIWNVLDTFPQN